MGLLQKWGLGAELTFDGRRAERGMLRAGRSTQRLRRGFRDLQSGASSLGSSLGVLALGLAPLAVGYNLLLGRSSALAADLEAQKLTMSVLLGDTAKADALIAQIREKAASTPFSEGDLIEGSKRLLRLSKDNVKANQELLDIALTMSALNPTKSVTDSVEAILDATSGGGFERLKEFGLAFRAEDFKALGRPGGEAWAQGVTEAIGQEMRRITRGEDLVGALSQTFGGRLSTLKDNVTQVFTGIGEQLNRFLGPALDTLTGIVKDLKGPVIAGFSGFLALVSAAWSRFGAPVFEQLQSMLDLLGERGISLVALGGFVFGALATLFVAFVSIGGGLVTVLGAVVSAATTLIGLISVPVIKAVGVSLLAIVAGLTAATIAGLAFFDAFAAEGESPLTFLLRQGQEAIGAFVSALGFVRDNVAAFLSGFLAGFGPIGPTLDKIIAPISRIFDIFARLFGLTEARGLLPLELLERMGFLVGAVLAFAFDRAASFAGSLLNVLETVAQVLAPLVGAILPIIEAINQLIAGTGTWGQLWTAVWQGVLRAVVAVTTGIVVLIVGMLEFLVRQLENIVSLIPGASAVVEGVDISGGLRQFRQTAFEAQAGLFPEPTPADEAVGGVEGAEQALNARRAEQERSIEANVTSTFEGTVDVKTHIDGKEIGRAQGALAVREGEKGSGPRLPAAQRGRVLRRGLEVTPLRPAEVL